MYNLSGLCSVCILLYNITSACSQSVFLCLIRVNLLLKLLSIHSPFINCRIYYSLKHRDEARNIYKREAAQNTDKTRRTDRQIQYTHTHSHIIVTETGHGRCAKNIRQMCCQRAIVLCDSCSGLCGHDNEKNRAHGANRQLLSLRSSH